MKKKLLVTTCLIVLGLFVAPKIASAEDTYATTRSTPAVREVSLNSGQSTEFIVGAIDSEEICSKYVVKVNVESNDKESFAISRLIDFHGLPWKYLTTAYYDNKATLFASGLDYTYPKGFKQGKEIIRITNYSSVPLKYKVGISSGLHVKSQECVDYSNIDFNL